ncbi:MAG: hypothetical protein K9N49_10080 [Candidatus Marinimicrobia bacterium]|nr:hypothetical protein [Candidatus Neomarinimicrobiota bacterium]
MADHIQTIVHETVWPWRTREGLEPLERAVRGRRLKALMQFLIMVVIGSVLFWAVGHRTMGAVVWGLSLFVLGCGLFWARGFAGIEAFGAWLGRVVSVGLTWGLLVPFFYIFFVPGHFLLWARGKDPLKRRFDPAATTYWDACPAAREHKQYRKQH